MEWLQEVVVDFLEVQGLKEAVESIRGAGRYESVAELVRARSVPAEIAPMYRLQSGVGVKSSRKRSRRVVVATPRVLKPDEARLWQFFLKLKADALLVRS